MLEKHVGGMLSPPASLERLAELSPFTEQACLFLVYALSSPCPKDLLQQVFKVVGRGWDEPAVDLVLPGLGWVSVRCSVDMCLVSR